jgi:hypothetical protein
LREFTIDQFLDHRRYTGILPGCGCSLKCERQEEAIEHDFYKVKWVPVWVKVDEQGLKLTFATEWLTKREIIVSSSSKSKRMSVAEKERERAVNIQIYQVFEIKHTCLNDVRFIYIFFNIVLNS